MRKQTPYAERKKYPSFKGRIQLTLTTVKAKQFVAFQERIDSLDPSVTLNRQQILSAALQLANRYLDETSEIPPIMFTGNSNYTANPPPILSLVFVQPNKNGRWS